MVLKRAKMAIFNILLLILLLLKKKPSYYTFGKSGYRKWTNVIYPTLWINMT